MLAVVVVFLRVEFEPHAGRYVNYIVQSSGDEGADHTVLLADGRAGPGDGLAGKDRRRCRVGDRHGSDVS
jgi:hypothetical protein